MLELLRIRDLALIEDLEMEFSPGMNVLTGETGAGKSFILKALQFLTGEKLAVELVRPGKEKAVVEALFALAGEERILRRELFADTGRSRFYVNDQLASQELVRDMRASLLLHASQHGQQKLLQPAYQARVLDDFMQRSDLLAEKDRLTRALADCAARRTALEAKVASLEEKRDVLEFQQAEIAKVNPKPGEEEQLETEREAFRNHTGVAESAAQALAVLNAEGGPGVLGSLDALERPLTALAKKLDSFADAPDKLLDARAVLRDIEARLRRAAARKERDTDIDAVEERLYALAQLKRKLKRSLDAIFTLREEIAENLSFLDLCGLERNELEREETALTEDLVALLAELNPARQQAASAFSAALREELRALGFSPEVEVIFDFSPHALAPDRGDCVELRARMLWKPNPGQPPQPLDRIASGGELSRFLLAIISLNSRSSEQNPTLIFDEVDAGVGGVTLTRVAERLELLAASAQMLLITHWPMLAARAKRHFVVHKEVIDNQTYTRCSRLAPADIPAELERMLGKA